MLVGLNCGMDYRPFFKYPDVINKEKPDIVGVSDRLATELPLLMHSRATGYFCFSEPASHSVRP